jgi:hypothetical protein
VGFSLSLLRKKRDRIFKNEMENIWAIVDEMP